MRAFLHDVVAFDRTQAVEAARLFNMMGRPRRLRVDVLIASAAIVLGASLATDNQADFSGFVVHGLKLLE
jgi:predicted nucleic acid-binding protein